MDNTNTDILTLFAAYTTGEITEAEFKTLSNWVNQHPKNKQQFLDYLVFHKKALSIGFVENFDKGLAWDKIVSNLEIPLKPKTRKPIQLYWKYAAAASIALIVALTIFLNQGDEITQVETPAIVSSTIETGTDKAILTLENGDNIALGNNQNFNSKNISSNSTQLIYHAEVTSNESKIDYNYLTIPRGGQFFVKLSDGTEIWLNSESQLKYPKSFAKGEARNVELVYGEAYFNVSPSIKNDGSRFKVKTNTQDVEVLGTEFNIKAYKDEKQIYTTLVEGSIVFMNGIENQNLSPNEQLIFTLNTNSIEVNTIDVTSEISWVQGDFVFNRKSLKDIMKVLSRWYDVDIVFSEASLQEIEFTGELGKQQSIEDILNLIKNTNIINAYEINESTIIIK